MDIAEFKENVLKFSDDQLVNEYFSLHDELSYDHVSVDDTWDEAAYQQYWIYDRPALQEQLKIVENELSYRHINL